MAEFLKLPHLVEKHRVAQMKIRRRRVETYLHGQRAAPSQTLTQLALQQDLRGSAAQFSELFLYVDLLRAGHRGAITVRGEADQEPAPQEFMAASIARLTIDAYRQSCIDGRAF